MSVHTGFGKVWRDLAPAAILLLVSLAAAGVIGLAPRRGQQQVTVIAPPWFALAQTADVVGRAGGALVDVGQFSNIIIAHSTDPGFVSALYRQGAMLVIDSSVLRGCLGLPAARDVARGAV